MFYFTINCYLCNSPQIKYLVPSFVVSVGAFLIYNIMKLHAKEIRIGNYLNVFYKGEFKEIHTVEIATFSMFLEGFDLQGIYFEPIPLTEEWLLKFGKIEWISKDIDGIFYWFNGEKKYLKFVHLLQNTYFYIEQKELLCVNI